MTISRYKFAASHDGREFAFNFPATRFAEDGIEPRDQAAKVRDEARELWEETFSASYNLDGMAREAMDVICAAETLLRTLPEAIVDSAYLTVLARDDDRGYFA